MGRSLAIGGLFTAALAAVAGWPQGYRDPAAYVWFWLLLVLAGFAARAIERRGFPSSSTPIDRAMRTAVIAFAAIVVCGMVLGVAGWLSLAPFIAVLALLAAVTSIGLRARTHAAEPIMWRTLPPAAFAAAAAVAACVVAVGMTHLPTRYDSLNYHLYFPARWLLDHRISIVPTPFGDEAPAYAPSNGELFFAWLMLPFHGDLTARVGQFPFYLLAGMAIYALARRMGAAPGHAIYPAAFFLLARTVVDEAAGADVDLVFVAMFLAALHFGLSAVDTDASADWLMCGMALGLALGTKFVALVYLPIFLALPFVRGIRRRALWAVPPIAVLAAPWFLRNWFIAGSPIYPSSLAIAGVSIARGAFDHAAMVNSVFHLGDVRLFPIVLAHGAGTPLFLLWIPFWLVGVAVVMRRGPSWPARVLALLPLVLVPLDWFAVPDNSDWRFTFPILAIGLLPLAFAFRASARWNALVHALYAAGFLWLIVGIDTVVPLRASTMPDYMRDWLSLAGLASPPYIVWFAAAALAAEAARRWLASHPSPALPAIAAFCAAAATLGATAQRTCPPEGCDLLNLSSAYIRPTMIDGWRWIRANVRGGTIAYAGNNIPYPLFGERLTNRVYYVNIDRHLDWRLHDYARAKQRRRDDAADPAGDDERLAIGSGVLRPAAPSIDGAVRPRYERMQGYRDAWIANLKTVRATHLFVTSLSAYEVDYMWHDAGGFPIEALWAQRDPIAFALAYANPQVQVYSIRLE